MLVSASPIPCPYSQTLIVCYIVKPNFHLNSFLFLFCAQAQAQGERNERSLAVSSFAYNVRFPFDAKRKVI